MIAGDQDASVRRRRLLKISDDRSIGFADIGQNDISRIEPEVGPIMCPKSNSVDAVSDKNNAPCQQQATINEGLDAIEKRGMARVGPRGGRKSLP